MSARDSATSTAGGVRLFGPHRVAKTEVTRQLAGRSASSFVRFDMSEYMERTRLRG